MPWMTHWKATETLSPRFRSHFFKHQLDELPLCDNGIIDAENYSVGEHAPRCPQCDKKVKKEGLE